MELTIILVIIAVAIAYAVFAERRVNNARSEGNSRLNALKAEGEHQLVVMKTEHEQRMKDQRTEAEHRMSELRTEAARAFAEYKAAAERAQEEYKQNVQAQMEELRNRSESDLRETKRERDDEKSRKDRLINENTALKASLETTQGLLKAAQEQAAKDERERQEKFDTELRLAREQMRAQFEREMAERSETLKHEAHERMERLKQESDERMETLRREAEERMETLKQTNTQQMSQIVDPLKKQLDELHRLVDDNKLEQSKNTSALAASIKAVFEHDKERDKTTQSLAEALKNRGKVQGDWGELVLENILRDSGLRRGEEYFVQENVKTATGANVRPDVIVKGADGSRIIIDSKVSLTAYTDYVGAENDEERTAAIKANYDSIWQHVVELSDMKYDKEVERAIPMVLMFVPNEGSYILAMNKDPQLGSKAYQKGVLIINPTNLMVVLRLMFMTWQNTRQERNNREILKAAGDLYDKYCIFAEQYVKLGNQLNTARSTYDTGMLQLREGRGNLSKRLETLRKFGVTPTKQIPENMQSLSNDDELPQTAADQTHS